MKMMESSEDGRKCSDKKMELGDDGVKTVECLRGRLLAERQASRTAKEDAERMSNKLVELEKMIKEEVRLRNKAEKKLKFLKEKLEALNISSILVESEQSSSEVSSSTTNELSEENYSDFQVTNSVTSSQDSSQNPSENYIAKESHEKIPHHNEDNSPIGQDTTTSISSSGSPEDFFDNPSCKYEDSKSEHNSSAELKSSAADNEISGDDHEDYVDNSLALVPMSLPDQSLVAAASKSSKEVKPVHQNVAEVLHSLKYIRENIQKSKEIRRMVRVGPT